jgi:hypothetical protein
MGMEGAFWRTNGREGLGSQNGSGGCTLEDSNIGSLR